MLGLSVLSCSNTEHADQNNDQELDKSFRTDIYIPDSIQSSLKRVNYVLNEVIQNDSIIQTIFKPDTEQKDSLILWFANELDKEDIVNIHTKNDTTIKVSMGGLALLRIYQIEAFPYALALQKQWCLPDNRISNEIFLPGYIAFSSEETLKENKTAYLKYFHSVERKNKIRSKQ